MNNIKYYILAYTKLIQLFLKKYVTLLYLLVKAQFTVEDGTDAFYFVDAFQEVMFDAYFLKE